MRRLVFFLLVTCLVHGQEGDRRRFTSEAFNKGEAIRNQMSLALWRKGSFHVTPVIGVRDLGYDENVFSTELERADDFSVSPEAGPANLFAYG